MNQYIGTLIGTSITFGATIIGSAVVFLIRGINEKFQKACMGLASGIMVAASVWSLIIPAIEMSEGGILPSFFAPVIGFILGGLFLYAVDKIIPHMRAETKTAEGLVKRNSKRTKMLITSVTLHNIPEGMAIGLAFSMAAQGSMTLAAAFALCIGVAIQNLPEGTAISLPLRQEGMPRWKAFLYGSLSGIVEPVGGFLIVLLSGFLIPAMPYMLAFAAGAMIYVVVEELVPESHSNGNSNIGVITFMAGFLIMMILDVALG